MPNGDGHCSFENGRNQLDTRSRYYKINVLGCGNLKFIMTCLGRVNMDTHWCYLCRLGSSQFSKLDHGEGGKWTVQTIRDHLTKLNNGTLNKKKPYEVQGCVADPLIDAIEPWDWIIPMLHV